MSNLMDNMTRDERNKDYESRTEYSGCLDRVNELIETVREVRKDHKFEIEHIYRDIEKGDISTMDKYSMIQIADFLKAKVDTLEWVHLELMKIYAK